MLGSNHSQYTLVDGTPDYMFNAMAAPRLKEMVPQAKFVVILRVRLGREGGTRARCACVR